MAAAALLAGSVAGQATETSGGAVTLPPPDRHPATHVTLRPHTPRAPGTMYYTHTEERGERRRRRRRRERQRRQKIGSLDRERKREGGRERG